MKGKCLLALVAAGLSAGLSAKEPLVDWWFEVEVLAFKHNTPVSELEELFPQPAATPKTEQVLTLIEQHLQPDTRALRSMLPLCAPQEPKPVATPELADPLLLSQLTTGIESLTEPNSNATETIRPHRSQRPDAKNPDHQSKPEPDPLNWINTGCQYDFESRFLASLLHEAPRPEAFIDSVPTTVDGIEKHSSDGPYLLSRSSLQLRELAGKLRYRSDVEPLLHMGWRQEVQFGRENAIPLRLMGGQNYARQYDVLGYPVQDTPRPQAEEPTKTTLTLMEQIDQALSQPLQLTEPDFPGHKLGLTVSELFELDGLFKVYLKYINRVPYLHIDAQLIHRREGDVGLMGTKPLTELNQKRRNSSGDNVYINDASKATQLYGFEFDQLRRIVSSQLHYFDHPLFGLVVEVRRYTKPSDDDNQTSNTE